MNRIVIDAREWPTTTGRYISNLVPNLETIDHKNEYIVLMKPKDLSKYKPSNPNFSTMACDFQEFGFAEQMEFKKQLEGLKPDLVHFGMVHQPIFYRGKVVTTIHDLTGTRFKNPLTNPAVYVVKLAVYKTVVKRAAKKSQEIITPSLFVKEDVAKYTGVNPSKITVTYESSSLIKSKPEVVKELSGKSFIMYTGRPAPHKNLARLIEAFQIINKSNPDLYLVLSGKIEALYQRVKDGVKSANIKNVVFTDFVSDSQLRWMYENCKAYVFPSLSEGFGLPGLEAMEFGAPVVSSNTTSLPEIYGEAAYYFDPSDVKDMARAIDKVINSPDLSRQLSNAGKQQVKKYSWEKMAEETLAVYNSALKAK